MLNRWSIYCDTLKGTWFYTILVLIVAWATHANLTGSMFRDIVLVAVGWSVLNFFATLFLPKQ